MSQQTAYDDEETAKVVYIDSDPANRRMMNHHCKEEGLECTGLEEPRPGQISEDDLIVYEPAQSYDEDMIEKADVVYTTLDPEDAVETLGSQLEETEKVHEGLYKTENRIVAIKGFTGFGEVTDYLNGKKSRELIS